MLAPGASNPLPIWGDKVNCGPEISKNTAVRICSCLSTSKIELLLSLTTRVLPIVSNVTEAAKSPEVAWKVAGAADSLVAARATIQATEHLVAKLRFEVI